MVTQKSEVITVKDVRASVQAKKKSELPKAEAMAQRAINILQKQKDLEYKKEVGRLKKFWDIFKTTNQYHTKWEKKQAQIYVNNFTKYRNCRK